MEYAAYTIFEDIQMTKVRKVVHLFGDKARKHTRIWRDVLGR